MKLVFTLLILVLSFHALSQKLLIEAGPTYFEKFDIGINGGISLLFSKNLSGVGIGGEVIKLQNRPVGFPAFIRISVNDKNGLLFNLQPGYLIMNESGGFYSKLGFGGAKGKLHFLLQLIAFRTDKRLNYGGNLTAGVSL